MNSQHADSRVELTHSGCRLHHIGIATNNENTAVGFYIGQGYRLIDAVEDRLQNVKLTFLVHPSQMAIELVSPIGTFGPVSNLLLQHSRGLVYHLCYLTDSIEGAVGGFERAGLSVICVSSKKPAVLFQGRMVAFYVVVGLGLIELLESQ